MKRLSDTWFAEGYIDFELKKYTLLAYLQQIHQCFAANKLYPQLADLIFHYNNVMAFRQNKKHLQENFPKRLTGVQLEKLQLLYQQLIEDDEMMQELEDIINFSADSMKSAIQDGSSIYEFVEATLTIAPVGLLPLQCKEGYFFLSNSDSHKTNIYHYRMASFEEQAEKYRSIKTLYLDEHKKSISHTYESIKLELLRHHQSLPNPAVYAIETSLDYPVDETLLPIAKRSLVKFIGANAA